MTSVVSPRTAVRAAVAVTLTGGFAAGAATVAPGVYLAHVPVTMAGGGAALLITLGWVIGRATRQATHPRLRASAQITATVARPIGYSRPLPDGTVIVLPIARQDGGDVA